jgi:hypothetical protein
VLEVGGELGGAGAELGALFAEGFGFVAERTELRVEFGHGRAQRGGFSGEGFAFSDGLGAHLGELGVLRSELGGLFFAALLFGGSGGELGVELSDALRLAFVEAVRLLEVGVGVAAAFFKPRERQQRQQRRLADPRAEAQCGDLFGEFGDLGLDRGALGLEGGGFVALAGDEVRVGLALVLLRAAASCHCCRRPSMRAVSAPSGAGRRRSWRSRARRRGARGSGVERGGELGDVAGEGGGGEFVGGEIGLDSLELGLHFGEFTLEGERALLARRAAGDGDVVKGLAAGREEEACGCCAASERAVALSGE